MIVVDASVIVDALTQRELDDLRGKLAGETLHAPDLIDYEILSAVRGLTLGGHLSEARARDALTDYEDLALRRYPSTAALRATAWTLRNNLTSYDAAYVALADRLGCALWTRDSGLATSARRHIDVELL